MKQCNNTHCEIPINLQEFGIRKASPDGLTHKCKICLRKAQTAKHRTKEGRIRSLLRTQKSSCIKRNYPMPTYTYTELSVWVLSQELFHTLFNAWEKSGFEKHLSPSIDRKDDYLSYTLDNIQLMTWKQNAGKARIDRKTGVNTKGMKAVSQFTLTGTAIAHYGSAALAARAVKGNAAHIHHVCTGSRNTHKKFIWKYTQA